MCFGVFWQETEVTDTDSSGTVGELKQPLCPGASLSMSLHVLAEWLCWHCSVLFER